MSANVRQTNFLGGEVSPFYWGRSELSVFGRGLRTMRNFFAAREGAAVSRPGSLYCGAAPGPCRLIPFVVSPSVAYALEFNHLLIRFWRNGALVESAPSTPYTVATTYTYAELADIKYAQIGDTLQLTHPAHAPAELKRFAEAAWALADTEFALPIPYWQEIATAVPTNAFAIDTNSGGWTYTPDPTHQEREWVWQVTALMQRRLDGQVIESMPVRVTQTWDGATEGTIAGLPDDDIVLGDESPIVISMPPAAAAPALPNGWDAQADFAITAYNVYRGRGDLFGFVGTTKTSSFKDVGDEPDYGNQPPAGTNPFVVRDQVGTIVRTEKPSAVTFFEQRRVFAGTTERPGFVWPSASGDFFNYDRHLVHLADEALEFELASYMKERVLAMLGQDRCIIGTDAAIWSLQGTQGPLSFDSFHFRREVGIGINHIPFLVVDNGSVLYARAKGHGVRDLDFANERGGLDSHDISQLARHLFIGQVEGFTLATAFLGHVTEETPLVQRDLVDWTYAEDPWGLVWAVRSDGKLLSLTYAHGAHQAWARHDTDGGYLSVCAIPEEQEDGVYTAVLRNPPGESTRCYIERFTSRVQAGRATDGNALDCAVLYEGAATDTITGLDHLEGLQVYATGPGLPIYGVDEGLVVTGGSITLPEVPPNNTLTSGFYTGGTEATSLTLYVGLKFTADLETLDLAQAEVRGKMKNVTRVFFEVDATGTVQVGESFDADSLKTAEVREVTDSYAGEGPRTYLVEMVPGSSWNQGGRATLRQDLPIATTVLALQREVEVGG